MPVPNANTRVEGALAGQFHYADLLPVEALAPPREGRAARWCRSLTPSFGFPYLVFNTKEGVLAQQPLRQAVADRDRRRARCWPRASATPASSSPRATTSPRARRSTPTAGTDAYNERDAARPRPGRSKAGYKGEPMRILTSRQYDFHYNMAL